MRRRSRSLLRHPVVRTLLFERFLITGSATLAFAAVAMGRVKPSEIPQLMDTRILTLFFVLTVAVELGKASDLFDRLVVAVVERARTSRGLAFSMIGVTARIPGLERGRLYHFLDPEKLFGHGPIGLLFSGALLSQAVSNVPAALLLAPAAVTPHGFRGLLYGVTAGACGSPLGSVANLIGAQIYVREGGRPGFFWKPFCAVSGVLLVLLVLIGVALLTLER